MSAIRGDLNAVSEEVAALVDKLCAGDLAGCGLPPGGLHGMRIFEGSEEGSMQHSFVVPDGVSGILVELWGGGGGGASGGDPAQPSGPPYPTSLVSARGGSGGGAGGYARAVIPVQAGDHLRILIGGGGAGAQDLPEPGNVGFPGSDGASSIISLFELGPGGTATSVQLLVAQGGEGGTSSGGAGGGAVFNLISGDGIVRTGGGGSGGSSSGSPGSAGSAGPGSVDLSGFGNGGPGGAGGRVRCLRPTDCNLYRINSPFPGRDGSPGYAILVY